MQMKNRMLFCALTAVVVLSCAVAVQTAIAGKKQRSGVCIAVRFQDGSAYI